MGVGYRKAVEVPKMQDQKLLMLCWRSFLAGDSNIVAGYFAHKGGQYNQ